MAALILVGVVLSGCGAKSASDTATESTTPSAPSAAGPTDCPSGRFAITYGGAPSVLEKKESVPAGYFVWNDVYGWHVRATASGGTGGPSGTMDGTIISSANLPSKPVLKPDDGAGSVTTADNKITFSLKAGATPVGFDFAVGCASSSVRFELMSVYGAAQPVDAIYLGRTSKAIENPFVAQRAG